MKDFTYGLIIFIISLVVLTIMLTKDIVNKNWEDESIKQGIGYYDSKTKEFKWHTFSANKQ